MERKKPRTNSRLIALCSYICALYIHFNYDNNYCAAIHVDFSPPPGKLTYEVIESAGSLQVCLVLANVGSYDVNATLDIPVSVHLSTLTQENTTMYDPG